MFSADAMDWYLGSVKMYITVLKSEIFNAFHYVKCSKNVNMAKYYYYFKYLFSM